VDGSIDAKFTSADQLINHGLFIGLSDITERLAGGDVYIKRAVAATLLQANGSRAASQRGGFEVQTLLGNVSTAQDYASYLQNTAAINALIAAEPESAFSAGWTITFARSIELGLNRRAATDWVGGFNAWMDELADGKIDGQALAPSQFSAFLDPFTNERSWGVTDSDGSYLGSVGDSIESGAKDSLTGTAGNDVIIVGTTANGLGQFTATGGFILNGEAQASAGADFTAISGTLTFNTGERSKSFTVAVATDGTVESIEGFVARPTSATLATSAMQLARDAKQVRASRKYHVKPSCKYLPPANDMISSRHRGKAAL
jgi:Calx-beta domain